MARRIIRRSSEVENSRTKRPQSWVTTDERFVAFFDIMGFKEFVARKSHKDVYGMMTKLSDTKDFIDNLIDEKISEEYIDKGLYTTSFSDSLIFFSKDNSIESFELITLCSGYLLASSIMASIPMKGAISYGTISVNKEKQIYFGQPIIDAYLLQEEVNYYGVVAHNSINEYMFNKKKEIEKMDHIFEVTTPLKSGNIVHTNIDWFDFININDKDLEISTKFKECIDKLKCITSGAPRKYIDNTEVVFAKRYNNANQ